MASSRSLGAFVMARLALAQSSSKAASATSSGKATSPSAAEASAAAKAEQVKAAGLNQDFYNYIFIILASFILVFGIWRIGIESVKYVRTLTCLNNDTQRYFALPSKRWASFKKHILYAPIFSKRHNREFQLSSAMNVGTLPTRFQLLFLLSYLGTNVLFCVYSIDWNLAVAPAAKELRNRTGILAVVNMVCHTDF